MSTKIPYEPPVHQKSAFNCPFCNAYASQSWFDLTFYNGGGYRSIKNLEICYCGRCGKGAVWYEEKMIFPDFSGVEPPNEDLEEDIKRDYEEAGSILQKSPRGTAALLRLAIQKLCTGLAKKDNLNEAIGELVKQGLPQKVQQSMDALRVIGNEAVHPGELDLRDDAETAGALFKLINFVAEKMITEPKEVDAIYGKIPDGKKKAIEDRDKQKDE